MIGDLILALRILPLLRPLWRPAMAAVLDAIKTNPVRLYAIASALLALVAFYVPGLPVVLILGVVAAILGTGETVRRHVAPMSKVVVHADDLADAEDEDFDGEV